MSSCLYTLGRAALLATGVTLAACAVPSKVDRVDVSSTADGTADTGSKTPSKNGADASPTRPNPNGTGAKPATPPSTKGKESTATAVPCVSSATETCGPFGPEFIQACRQYSGANPTACLNPKWSKTWYESLANHVRGHLSDETTSATWSVAAAKCSFLYLAKDLKVALRSEANPDKSAVFAELTGSQMTVVPLETWGGWRKVRVNAMGAPDGAGGKEGWLLGMGLTCSAPQ